MAASDMLTPAPAGRYLLHHVAERVKALYDELSQAHVVVLDVPPAAEMKYEDRLFDNVNRIRQAGPQVGYLGVQVESPTFSTFQI